MAHKRTVAFFEEWRRHPENIDALFRLMEVGEGVGRPLRFRDACMKAQIPYTLMHALMKASPELKARYDAVRAANADEFAHQAVEIVDAADTYSKAGVMKAKVQADVRLALASKWDRDDYGESIKVEKSVSVTVDAGLLGRADELLRLVEAAPREIEGETLALPAPEEAS